MNARPGASILIVEDDPQQVRLYKKALAQYQLSTAPDASSALRMIAEQSPDLIILDNVLSSGESGAEFLPRFKQLAAHVPIVVISGTLDIAKQLRLLQGPLSAHYVIEKPVQLEELETVVRTALQKCGFGETVQMLRSLERCERIENNEPERRFTERLARQHEILNRLRESGEPLNVSALARDFKVDRKTIQRDLHDLVDRGQIDPHHTHFLDGPAPAP